MSNNTDDTMRRIEEALDRYSEEVFNHASDETLAVYETALLATIRAALQPDAGGWGEDDDRFRANEEHERAVEAWEREFTSGAIGRLAQHPFLTKMRDEALRLMRRQPKETTDG